MPAPTGKGWWNERNGKVLSRHQLKDLAVEAGREIAQTLRVGHTVHCSEGEVSEVKMYEAGQPSAE